MYVSVCAWDARWWGECHALLFRGGADATRAPSCAPSELQLQQSSMFEPNPFPNIPAIERSPPADAKVRRIKAQLAPRMVTIGKQRKLADVLGIMSDATVGTPPPSVSVCHT